MDKRNKCLNFLKGISCIGVVLMHCGFPYPWGKLVGALFMFAVPVFFMISGYYAYYEQDTVFKEKIPKKMKHILKLTIIAELGYGVIVLLRKNRNIQFDIDEVIIKIFVGTFFNGTLWFLYALFWSYACLYVIHNCGLYKIFYKIAPIILVFHVIARTYTKNLDWYDWKIFRNFLQYGLPYVIIGNCVHRNKEILCGKIKNGECLVGIVLGVGITIVEYLISRQVLDFYIGTIIMSCSMFMYAIKNPENKINSILSYIGDKLSMYVYVFHILAIWIVEDIGGILAIGIYEWLKPINAILISIVLAYLCRLVLQKIKIKGVVSSD